MSDQRNGGIAWTDQTAVIDRNGRRIRYYAKKRPWSPGVQERKKYAALGLKWCRGCKAWLGAEHEVKQGACKGHRNAEYRAQYAAGGKVAISQRVHARKRKIAALPKVGVECLMEHFEGKCAYCGKPATAFDHVAPVISGGETVPGNIVPACTSCNSSKKHRPLDEWLAGRTVSSYLIDTLILSECSHYG